MAKAAPPRSESRRSRARPLYRVVLAAACSAGPLSACMVYSDALVDDAALTEGSGAADDGKAGADSSGSGAAPGGKPSGSGGASGTSGSSATAGGGVGNTGNGPDTGDAGAGSGGDGGDQGGTTSDGGTGGSGGAAGSAGSSSAGSGGGATGPGDLIDGFEDDDLTLEQTSGRGGVWYLFDDGTVGTAGPAPLVCGELSAAPEELGSYAMHITATGFTGWGSGLGVDFRAGKKVYDGSQYSGIRFWARVGTGKNTHHRVQLVDGTSDKLGGKCNPAVDALDGEKCDDHFGINLTFTSTWTQYVVRFDQLTQVGWGNSAPEIDSKNLYGLQVTAKAKMDVDLWLDQIEFF